MEMQSFQFIKNKGWSVERFPDLDSPNTLVLVFASPLFLDDLEAIKQLSAFYPTSKLVGCSTAGEIYENTIADNSLSVTVVKFHHTTLKIAKTTVSQAETSYEAGLSIVEQLNTDTLKSIFVLSDGLKVNGSELVRGLNTTGKKDLVITGGLAGDGSNFIKTWTLLNGVQYENQVVAIGFYGDRIHVGHASKGGWDIFGPVRRVTRSEGNVLYELDYQPALQLYKEYLGDKSAELPASGLLYPLSISDPSTEEPVQLVRTILGVDEANQALIFAGDIPVDCHAQLMRANFDRLIDSATDAGELAVSSIFNGKKTAPVLAIAISCVGRRLLLGERIEEEVEFTLETLPLGSTQVGFYSYGEISPFSVGNCELHNQTMTITLYYES